MERGLYFSANYTLAHNVADNQGDARPVNDESEASVQSLKDLWFGITQQKWKTATYAFTYFSMMFTVVKVVTQFFPNIQISGAIPLTAGIAISLGWAVRKVWKPSKVSIRIPHTKWNPNAGVAPFVHVGWPVDDKGTPLVAE